MYGWFPNGVRKQEKYIHLNCLYTGIIFTYLLKAQYRFSSAFYYDLEKSEELLFMDVVTTRLDPCIYINLIVIKGVIKIKSEIHAHFFQK